MARPAVLKHPDPGAGSVPADSGRRLRCPLCAKEFSADSMACHAGCPISRHCRVLCCPHCGYEFPDEEATRRRVGRLLALLESLRRAFGKRR